MEEIPTNHIADVVVTEFGFHIASRIEYFKIHFGFNIWFVSLLRFLIMLNYCLK